MRQRAAYTAKRAIARRMRAAPTDAEAALWHLLREMRRQRRAHFRRQAPVGPFIVDFVDFKRQIIVEADGGQHGGDEDRRRDALLEDLGFTVLRFWNDEILSNPEGVWQVISDALSARLTPTLTLPARGRELAPRPKRSASPPPCGEGMGVGESNLNNPRKRSEP